MTLKGCFGYDDLISLLKEDIDFSVSCIKDAEKTEDESERNFILDLDKKYLAKVESDLETVLNYQFYDDGQSKKDKELLAIMEKGSLCGVTAELNKQINEVKAKNDEDNWIYYVPITSSYLLMKDIAVEAYSLVDRDTARFCSNFPNFKFQVVLNGILDLTLPSGNGKMWII